MFDLLLIGGGLIFLFLGGEALVRGSVSIAERFKLSHLVTGVVIVGFGTSTPELLVSLNAALAGTGSIALGNVVGSNMANILLILGAAALVTPLPAKGVSLLRDTGPVLAATVALLVVVQFGVVDRLGGLILLIGLIGYIAYNLNRKHGQVAAGEEEGGLKLPLAALFVAVSLALLTLGADWLVEGASNVALRFGVSEAVVGLSVVAVGTSLPELAAAAVAAYRGKPDMILGNILGSNVFNLLAILGITALVVPIPAEPRFAALDVPLVLAVTVLLAVLLARLDALGRLVGAAFLLLYAAYMAFLF